MTLPHHRTTATPRWTTLAALVAAVLGLHLMLLGGWRPDAQILPASTPAGSSATPANPTTKTAPPPTPPAAHPTGDGKTTTHITTVRWVVAPTTPPAAVPAPELQPVQKPTAAAKPPLPATPTPPQVNPAPTTASAEAAPAPAPERTEESAPPESTQPAEAPPPLLAQAPAAAPEIARQATPGTTPQATAGRSERQPPASPPASVQLAYDVSGNARGLNYSARATLDWQLAGGQYNARMELRVPLLGSRVQTSVGRVEPHGLQPERFADKSRSERAAHFDYARQTIRFSNNRPDATLQPGAQDRLSLFMQLAGMLRAQPAAYPAGRLVSLQVAGTSDAETWRFRVGEEEALTLPAGPLQARRLVREPREPRDSRVDIWLAPELAYLPVRIRITQDNGDRVDQQLSQMP